MDYEDLVQFDTKLTADVCEWQPLVEENYVGTNYTLACATYFLNKETNQRQGCLYLMDYNLNTNQLRQIENLSFNSSGILDMKWLNASHILTLDSKETVELFNYENEKLKSISKLDLNETEAAIGLTFDFTTNEDKSKISKLVASNSKGELNIINSEFEINNRFKAHDYEIWSVYINRSDENIIHSGADDCLIKIWDLRDTTRAKQQCNLFSGGVCTILGPYYQDGSSITNLNAFNLLCSSYDEQIYLLDKRNLKNYVKKSKKLDGGVWKMRLNYDNLILCACMHTGVHIVDLQNLNSKLYYDKHGINNLAYGCDWVTIKNSDQLKYLVATCSFYNHELRLWKIK